MRKATKNPLDVFKPAKTVGHLIKAFRKNFGISQEQMAEICEIAQANLSKIENGSRPVGPDVALKLSAFMGLSPEVILYPNGYEKEPAYRAVRERTTEFIPMYAKSKG